jgi:hypothetical protein
MKKDKAEKRMTATEVLENQKGLLNLFDAKKVLKHFTDPMLATLKKHGYKQD